MLFAEVANLIVASIISAIIVWLFFIIFMVSRYRKFKIDQFVIHLRHGKLKHVGLGGSLWLLPLIDEYIIIPRSMNQTELKIKIPIPLREHKRIIKGNLIWKVIDPQKCYNELTWDVKDKNYAENILKKTANALIRNICDKMTHTQIIQERQKLNKLIGNSLQQKVSDWGINIELCEIQDAYLSEKFEKTQFLNLKV